MNKEKWLDDNGNEIEITEEYIIISKTAIQKRIEELENFYMTARKVGLTMDAIDREIETLKQILSQSTPLIPEIEKAYEQGILDGTCAEREEIQEELNDVTKDYISNLKLDI